MKTNVLRCVIVCCMMLMTSVMAMAGDFKGNDVYQYRKSFAEAAGMRTGSSSSYYEPDNLFTVGLGYWDYELETYGLQMTNLRYNGWASEMNIRWNFSDYTCGAVDMAILGYSFGLTEFNNGALYLALVGGPTIRIQDEYDYEDDKEKIKFYIDAYISASLNVQLGERFLLKGGYYFWAPQFKFGEDYRADGFYVSLGYAF